MDGNTATRQLRIYSMRELKDKWEAGEFKVDYYIPQVYAKGQAAVFGAGSKMLKTTLMCDLYFSLALSLPFLGRFPCKQSARTVFFSGESGAGVLAETIDRIARSKDRQMEDASGLFISPDIPRLGEPPDREVVRQAVLDREADIVAFDPSYLCLADPDLDSHRLDAMGRRLGEIVQELGAMGVDVAFAHHGTKSSTRETSGFLEMEGLQGAGWSQYMRQWFLISRQGKYAGDGTHKLMLNVGGTCGHSGRYGLTVREGTNTAAEGRSYDVLCEPWADAMANNEAEQEREKKRAENRKRERQMHGAAWTLCALNAETEKKWREGCTPKLNPQDFQQVKVALLNEGIIEKTPIKKAGVSKDGHPGWKIAVDKERLRERFPLP